MPAVHDRFAGPKQQNKIFDSMYIPGNVRTVLRGFLDTSDRSVRTDSRTTERVRRKPLAPAGSGAVV